MTSETQHGTALQVVSGVDLTGREAIVTGGYNGLGYETARALAAAGARVVIAGRDPDQGEAAVRRLTAAAPAGQVVYRHLDLARLASVTAWTRWYNATGRPCHLLIANAGVMAAPLTRTAEGFELQFGVNHLGHFAFVTGLLPSLRTAGAARVVVLSSAAHRRSRVDFADPNYLTRPYDPWTAYGQSKTANALFAVGFHRRHGTAGLTANAVHPGGVTTELLRHVSPAERAARGFPAPHWKTPEQGAATSVWAAVAPELAGVGGRYLEDCALARPWTDDGPLPAGHYLPYALDEDDAEALWTLSEQLISQPPPGD